MNATVEKLTKTKSVITITVEQEKFEECMEKAYRKNVKLFNVPGFRRGHAPRALVERYYGPSALYEDAFEFAFKAVYADAVEQAGVKPIDNPELDVKQIEKGKELIFTATIYEYPEVELGDYKAIRVEKVVDEVTDDDVSAEIERDRNRVARFVDVTDRPVKLDDEVNLDYSGFCEGNQFEGGTAKGQKLTIGSGQFIAGFEEQLVGHNIGDEFTIQVKFPEEYHSEELKGKDAEFKVKINSISVKELPELDDEFAKDVSEFDTLDAYKTSVRERLEKNASDKADSAFENEVIEKAVECSEVELPEPMIRDEVDSMLRDMRLRMAYQGLKFEDYLKYTGQSEEQMREMYKEQAETRVRTRVVLDAIKKADEISATDEEVDARIAEYAENSKKSLEEFKAGLSDDDKEYFKLSADMQKTVDSLKALAQE